MIQRLLVAPLAPKSESIQVCVLKPHPEPDRLPFQSRHISAKPPADDAFDLVSEDLGTVFHPETRNRVSALVL